VVSLLGYDKCEGKEKTLDLFISVLVIDYLDVIFWRGKNKEELKLPLIATYNLLLLVIFVFIFHIFRVNYI
jgi:hypothetical protein